MEFKHTSVLLNETIGSLMVRPDGVYLDGTLGGAGHSSLIASKLTTGHLYGFDQDEDAIKAASERLDEFKDKVTVIRDNYRNAVRILKEMGITGADGIMLDLGVSSYQFDNGERGFSYNTDAPLDMRMDTRKDLTAAVIVNEYPEEEIRRILRDYGEEKFAHQIASNIVKERSKGRIETTFELNEIIKNSIPAKFRAGGHPSRQTFQALRIACNEELDVLETSLDDMADFLNPGGRLSIITFHSLEDRVVKNAFKRFENPCVCPPNFPKCVCGRISKGKVITRKPIIPTDGEIEDNPRSRSAKLRVFERTL
ncbi:MAG: 16S rRNA (cytosine(1402)-N(4))-methyltransferase RsmH [Lachnospiraceae bacterium]|nr:16S rRNA (cytosine(1402)-N(4))-methyltransferase RsmH [Lachnospiraceae bacterium]MBO7096008.1 16S rRNA (cytosine(1402)-N(4))-methyltransferase RsmH [Lachnospiraceae bacterium]MBO7362443.1 16S rRNA (cytosine(1402)-N(4))-methyltransferase RsmH [Lachnospiraceae bacterium]MBO7530803.1 16S rRNA (cytosine(1402)-N(4))-methyltransferase RsmH [Lachnospiraceae bacterium]MBP5253361.1 16S rRNA (cytosine(1402)-N(4))-methyltransferase RsmH [Lachnospiraceae bacterium]